MAKIPNGILGPISGKIADVVAVRGKRGTLLRKAPRRRKDKPSTAQQAQRSRFLLMSKFLTPLGYLLKRSFNHPFLSIDPPQMALSYNLKNAVCGVYPDYHIDYSLVWLSYGHLPAPAAPSVSSDGPGRIRFRWTDNSGQGKASPADRAILVIYSEATNAHISRMESAERNAGTDILEIIGWSGRRVHAWLGFISHDGKDISPGIYAGALMVE